MGVSENARLVLEKRYLIKDADGKAIESVDGMFQRVAGGDCGLRPAARQKRRRGADQEDLSI